MKITTGIIFIVMIFMMHFHVQTYFALSHAISIASASAMRAAGQFRASACAYLGSQYACALVNAVAPIRVR